MLKLEALSVTYADGTAGLDKLDLTIGDGETVALIGANGAGKTTLIMSLVGVLPSSGKVWVNDLLLEKKTVAQIRSRIGVVLQNPDDQLFMPSLDDDLAFGLRNQGVLEEEIRRRVSDCLTQLGIQRLSGKTAFKMSGGEKRMAALATVLVMEPEIMLFDEPTAFLDPRARRKLIGVLKGLPQTKLIATHDLAFAEAVCERSVLLKEGKIFADGPSKTLLYDQALMEACGVEAIGV